MPIRRIGRWASTDQRDAPAGGPLWNSLRVDPSTDTLVFGTGTSGSTEKTAVDLTSTQTLTNKTLTSPVVTGLSQSAAVISGQGATATLTAAQSGSIVLFDRAAGIVYTLPAPTAGLNFTFLVTVSVTSNNYKVITDAGTTLLIGAVTEATSGGAASVFVGNGTTHIATLMNGTTTGGLQGTALYFYATGTAQWAVDGINVASGTIATPFSAT